MTADPKAKALAVGIGVLLVLGLIGGALAYRQVPEGHEGVTKEWGAVTGQTLDSGAHWKIPVMQSVQNVETRPRTYTMSNTAGEGDRNDADAITVKTVNGSSVNVDVTVRYRINKSEADDFVAEWNNEEQMEQRLIRPTVRSDLRDEASDIQTSDVYTREGRERLAETARESLAEQFSGQPIVLEAVQVRNIDLPDSIDQRLDEKEQAKQQVQIEQERVKQEEQRAEQEIIQAEADAEAVNIRAEAYEENPVMLQVDYIEAMDDGSIFVVPEGSETPIIMDPENPESSTEDGIPATPESDNETNSSSMSASVAEV